MGRIYFLSLLKDGAKMDKKELEQIEFTSSEEALQLAKYADTGKTMFNAVEIARFCEKQFAGEKDTEWKQKRIYQTIYLAGIMDGVRKERAKRKGKIHQKFLELEMNTTELEISLEKLRLLTNDLREDYFGFDEKKAPENVLYYYGSAGIKCDIVIDYILELQAIANNIDCLTYAILGKSSHD